MSTAPVSRQIHYRIRTDTGTIDATPTWAAAEDTAAQITPGTAFRIRISVENTGTASDTITEPTAALLGIQRNGSSTGVTFTQLTNILNGADAGASADAANVATQRLTSGTGTFITGTAGYDENETLACTILNGRFTEVEFGVVVTGGVGTAGIGGGEFITFEVGGLTNASTQLARFTTATTNGSVFSHGNQLGGAAQTVANSASISMTTAAAISANDLVVVVVTCDNNGTGDGDLSEISGVTIDGNVATKAVEYTNGQGLAQAGVTTSIWWRQFPGGLATSKTITATFTTATTSGDANTIQARAFGVASSKVVTVEATNGSATDAAAEPASLNCTTSSIECLRVAARGVEASPSASGRANIKVSGLEWSPFIITGNIGLAATGNCGYAEANISTGTGKASAPIGISAGSAADWASAYVAFRADPPAAPPTTPPDFASFTEVTRVVNPIGY